MKMKIKDSFKNKNGLELIKSGCVRKVTGFDSRYTVSAFGNKAEI